MEIKELMEEMKKLSLKVSLFASYECEKRNIPAQFVSTVLLTSLEAAIVSVCSILLKGRGKEEFNTYHKNINNQIKAVGEQINEYLSEQIEEFDKESKG